jgi:hypothetical protein
VRIQSPKGDKYGILIRTGGSETKGHFKCGSVKNEEPQHLQCPEKDGRMSPALGAQGRSSRDIPKYRMKLFGQLAFEQLDM